jgi:hypothetical protein
VRWGILGPGRISVAFLTGLAGSAEESAAAVGSRAAARAEEVGARFGVPRRYGSYAELVADPDVDAVYIGLPNSLHAEWTVAAVRAGKHVLCEKPLARGRAEAESLFQAAREHGRPRRRERGAGVRSGQPVPAGGRGVRPAGRRRARRARAAGDAAGGVAGQRGHDEALLRSARLGQPVQA